MVFMNVLMYPVATEKALNMVDKNNIIVYIVDFRAGKKQIKEEFEKTFGVKVKNVNTAITMKNTKKAFIKLSKDVKASDIARKLKLV
jgi:ribosomal protein L23